MLSPVDVIHRSPSVPPRYAMATLESYRAETAATAAALTAAVACRDRLVAGQSSSLVLLGPPGVGKSHLAAAICHAVHDHLYRPWAEADDRRQAEYEAARKAWDARDAFDRTWDDRPRRHRAPEPSDLPQWANLPSLLTDLRAEMSAPRDEQHRTDHARRLRTHPGLLVLDDIGRERVSEWTGELVYTVVNDRYERRLPTIATSNLSADELVASGYWPAISRLAEDGRLVTIEAPDQRLVRR